MSAAKPRCFVCEEAIDAGEPFKLVQAWRRAASARALPEKAGGDVGVQIVQRAVHYSCELEAQADAAGAGGLVVEGAEDEDLTTREKLGRLMGGALDLVDFFDELL